MKKIFTLATAFLMAIVVFAADRRPTVTLQGSKNYEVFIDGRLVSPNQYGGRQFSGMQFGAMEINNLRNGRHTITVYEMPRRFYANRVKRVISQTSFMLRGNDVAIRIDQFGQVRMKESRGNGFDNRDWNDRNDRDWNDRNDNGYDGRSSQDRDYRNHQGQDGRGSKNQNDRY